MQLITQPPCKKLLADPVHPDFHPKTLVLNLTGTLVKSEYIFGKGNKTIVRPGLENFLHRLITKYEIIIFAEEDSAFIVNSLNSVDPKHRYISSVFGKESMIWRSGSYIKDLKYLNRDLKKVIVIDRLKDNVRNQPENLILLPEFDGQKDDHELSKLVILLERTLPPPKAWPARMSAISGRS
jgi:mitochondrial import inner membrane translocase subunit TIM50